MTISKINGVGFFLGRPLSPFEPMQRELSEIHSDNEQSATTESPFVNQVTSPKLPSQYEIERELMKKLYGYTYSIDEIMVIVMQGNDRKIKSEHRVPLVIKDPGLLKKKAALEKVLMRIDEEVIVVEHHISEINLRKRIRDSAEGQDVMITNFSILEEFEGFKRICEKEKRNMEKELSNITNTINKINEALNSLRQRNPDFQTQDLAE